MAPRDFDAEMQDFVDLVHAVIDHVDHRAPGVSPDAARERAAEAVRRHPHLPLADPFELADFIDEAIAHGASAAFRHAVGLIVTRHRVGAEAHVREFPELDLSATYERGLPHLAAAAQALGGAAYDPGADLERLCNRMRLGTAGAHLLATDVGLWDEVGSDTPLSWHHRVGSATSLAALWDDALQAVHACPGGPAGDALRHELIGRARAHAAFARHDLTIVRRDVPELYAHYPSLGNHFAAVYALVTVQLGRLAPELDTDVTFGETLSLN